MSEVLQVPKDKVLKAYEKAKTGKRKVWLENMFGIKTFQPDVKERIKNFDDVLRENNISKKDFEKQIEGLEPDEVAYKKAKLVCLAYNEGWKPNWDNSSEHKYYPWFDMRSSASGGFSCDFYDYWYSYSCVGSRLCFKSSDLAKTAGQLFEQEIYKPLFTL